MYMYVILGCGCSVYPLTSLSVLYVDSQVNAVSEPVSKCPTYCITTRVEIKP